MTLRGPLMFCLIGAVAPLLGGCGFHLRAEAQLPPGMQRVQVVSSDPFGPLKRDIEKALVRSGATIVDNPGDGVAEIRLNGVSIGPIVRSVSVNARVNEFTMLYHVELQVTDAAGKVLLPNQVIEQSRIFTFDQTQAIGTGAEQDEIKKEMERDMVQLVLRKIESVEHKAG